MGKTIKKDVRSSHPRRNDDKKRYLEQKSALALKDSVIREALNKIEQGSDDLKNNIIANVENIIMPIIQKLELNGESHHNIQFLRDNLLELVSTFGAKLAEKRIKLTHRQIEICNLIRNGFSNKEISSLLHISERTTEKHRANIRKKLGIKKDYNLLFFLKAL